MQNKDLPTEIYQDFTAKFPEVKRVDWTKEGNEYKASFSLRKLAYALVYDADGKLVLQQNDIPKQKLPSDVADGIQKNFPELSILSAAIIDEKGKTSYKCVLQQDNIPVESVYLAPDGRVIKTETNDNN